VRGKAVSLLEKGGMKEGKLEKGGMKEGKSE
jgi:hypothetical protein